MLLIAANLAAGSFAATVYALIAARWVRRGTRTLAILNALVAAGGVAVALGYAWLLWDGTAPRPGLPLLGFVFLLPSITRFIELQREERRDAYARHLGDSLRKIDDDPETGAGGE